MYILRRGIGIDIDILSFPLLVSILALCLQVCEIDAYLTLESMYEITNLTVEARVRIEGGVGGMNWNGEEQAVLALGVEEDRREEVEDDVTASLNMVNQAILEYLNIQDPKSPETQEPFLCSSVTENYHSFLEKTTLFLRAVEDTQITWKWGGDSPVFDSLGYLQALWASRWPNKQNRSFIEQQMALYSLTGCFAEKGNEVLRRDVEVVEYMNDLLDTFR